ASVSTLPVSCFRALNWTQERRWPLARLTKSSAVNTFRVALFEFDQCRLFSVSEHHPLVVHSECAPLQGGSRSSGSCPLHHKLGTLPRICAADLPVRNLTRWHLKGGDGGERSVGLERYGA